MSTAEIRLALYASVREFAAHMTKEIGPEMTVALLEFISKGVEATARSGHAWNEETFQLYREHNARALEKLDEFLLDDERRTR